MNNILTVLEQSIIFVSSKLKILITICLIKIKIMKNFLLFVLVFGLGFSSFSQTKHVLRSTKAPNLDVVLEKVPQQSTRAIMASEKPAIQTKSVENTAATFIPIGQAGNAYGFYNNSRTYLWADQDVNSVVFTHRMTGGTEVEGNSRIAYDVSTDGGATWATNVNVYTPLGPGSTYPDAAGRYPQGGIINPTGNTDPANAFYTYYICTLDGSNADNWGGTAYGSNVLNETDPSNPSQVNLTSSGDYIRYVPEAFTVATGGVAWGLDPSIDWSSGSGEYTGNVILGKGEISGGEVVYEETLFEALAYLDGINDSKVAFGPDGLTGYIMLMSDSESDPQPYTSYHPILYKTTDGGDSWSDAIHVELGGTDGMESVKNYWSDEIMEEVYGAGFNRDEIYYNMGFQCDIIVDGKGNPHVTGIIALGTVDGWYPGEGTMATWHLYSDDGGTTWDGDALYDNIFLDGLPAGLEMYNRPYAASTMDGHYLFFSWIDTDLDGAEENANPNIFVTGYDSEDHTYNASGVQNVTAFSAYWFSAFYGSMSQYVFGTLNGEMWDCEIPFVFTEYTVPGDPASEMNFYYIKGFNMPMPVGIDSHEGLADFAVSQNHPNPAVNNTSILVTTEKAGVINLRVNNILGQVVYQESVTNGALAHTFNVNVSNLESGIYFYTIQIGESSITKKMLVK